TTVSSHIFAWLLRDVLRCGTRSEDKALPRLAFNVPAYLRYELVRGAFSGDGSAEMVQHGRNWMLSYATASKALADGMVLLLQTLGVIPSMRTCWMKKSRQPIHLLRVGGYDQIMALKDVFGAKQQARIADGLASYQRHNRPHGYAQHGAYATLTVREVACEEVETTVYSLETSTGTLIASSGLISHNCLPKDIVALTHMAGEKGLHPQLLEAVKRINLDQRHVAIEKLEREL